MAGQRALRVPAVHVPHADGGVAGAGHEGVARGRDELHVGDAVVVPLRTADRASPVRSGDMWRGCNRPQARCRPHPRDGLEGKGPQRRPQKRLGRRLEEVAEAVGGGYRRLQMPLKLTLAVRVTVAGRRLGALEGGGGGTFRAKLTSRW